MGSPTSRTAFSSRVWRREKKNLLDWNFTDSIRSYHILNLISARICSDDPTTNLVGEGVHMLISLFVRQDADGSLHHGLLDPSVRVSADEVTCHGAPLNDLLRVLAAVDLGTEGEVDMQAKQW